MILNPINQTLNNNNKFITDSPQNRLLEIVKTALINIFVYPYATVCDLYCGRVPDEERWNDAQIGHFIGIDEVSSGVSEVREAWESQRKIYTSEFYELDPCIDNLEANLGDKGNTADIVCCMQRLQFCFETEEKVQRLLHNVSALLKPGGFLIGITLDSSTIWAKYQKNVEAYHNRAVHEANLVPNCIRSENYMITFEVEEKSTHVTRLAREAGLEYVEIQNLLEFYDDNRAQFSGTLLESGHGLVDPRGRLLPKFYDILGCVSCSLSFYLIAVSKIGHNVSNLNIGLFMYFPYIISCLFSTILTYLAGLYTTFIFQKPDPDVAPPLMTPLLHDGSHGTQIIDEREWQGREDDKMGLHTESTFGLGKISEQKGILGPGPSELRFSDGI
ncbi:S-adenosyl-L-methionine-dependent methyltransferases superfamily protein [Artemisia annua]|uniref:mRNA (guanine-N(7))-methyltransferase n=1 Tax=Artemisia annua TaxID=35608 RepID=A0A2U1NZP8_ARTAN|nr:S-adenosyl-L-methionine-dependent methyltransferases superfamily protein [Artemisia annua]